MPVAINIIGRQFGKLTVIAESETLISPGGTPARASLCKCTCGREVVVRNGKLTSGYTQSCGCMRSEALKTHGYGTRDKDNKGIYVYWKNLKRRDNVCERWKSFTAFFADVGDRPEGHGLALIDRSKPWQAGNVEWKPTNEIQPVRADQLTINGITGSLASLCEKIGVVSYRAVLDRMSKGMSATDAIITPPMPHEGAFKHGGARRSGHTREYKMWRAMIARCTNPNHVKFADYGGRGIRVCEAWKEFDGFIAEMGECPVGKCSIGRKDNDKGYSKDNCQWEDAFEQANNKRNTTRHTVRGFTGTLAQVCRHFSCPYQRTLSRLRRGMEIDKALFSEYGTSADGA